MSNRRNDIQIGLFSVIALLLLAMTILVFGGFKSVLASTYTVRAYFGNASGIGEGTPVRLLGIEIGSVRSISLDVETGGVVMELDIDDDADIRLDAPLSIKQEGFIANTYMDFGMGTSEEFLPKDGSAKVSGDVDTFAAYIEQATTVITNMGGSIKERVLEVSKRLSTFIDDLNDITGDKEFRTNLKRLAANSAELTEALREKLPTLVENIDNAVVKMQASVEESGKVLETYNQLGKDLSALSEDTRAQLERQGGNLDRLTDSFVETAQSVSTLAGDLSDVAGMVKSGEGTVGKLFKDDELYRSLVDAIDELEEAARVFKELAETIKKHPDWLLKGPDKKHR